MQQDCSVCEPCIELLTFKPAYATSPAAKCEALANETNIMNSKHLSIQSQINDYYLNYILNAFQDHYIAFFTYTFKNSFRNLSYFPALTTFFRNCMHAAVSRPSTRPINVQMLCIKEKSPLSSVKHMEKPPHFHGHLMIPKKYQQRFCERAVINYKIKYYDVLDKEVPVLNIHKDLYDYYPSKKNSEAAPILTNYDLDVRVLSEEADIVRTFNYSTKRIGSLKYNDADDDNFILFS